MDYAVIYDNVGTNYYLVLHNAQTDRWEFLGIDHEDALEQAKEATGITQMKPIGRMKDDGVTLVLIEANMNIPVSLSSSYDTYLWAPYDRAYEKLTDSSHKGFLKETEDKLKSLNI